MSDDDVPPDEASAGSSPGARPASSSEPADAAGDAPVPAATRGDTPVPAERTGDTPLPPESQSPGLEATVLAALPSIAAMALLALVLGRMVGPAFAGAFVGADQLVQGVTTAGDVASQAFALGATLATMITVLAAARSRLPLPVRFGALALGGVGVVTTLFAQQAPVATESGALVSACAALVALLAAGSAVRAPFARGAAAVVGLVAAGALVRLGAVGLAFAADAAHLSRLGAIATALVGPCATVAFALDGLAVAIAVAWVGRSTRADVGPRVVNGWTIAPLALAMIGARYALIGEGAEAPPFALLLARATTRLLSLPEPSVSPALRVFFALVAPLTAASALAARGPVPALGAAVALALLARGSLEMPPCALMLVIGALGLALAANEGRGLWAALPSRASRPPR